MGQGTSGVRRNSLCPYCGQRYTLTNFMSLGRRLTEKDATGRRLTNTHERACYRKIVKEDS